MSVRGTDAPLVSILVPTIGRLDYLRDTIASVRDQTIRDFEVLVLDNASSPAAAEALEQWANSDGRVRILRAESRIPMFANFNRGIAAAAGKYITFFHDDDLYLPRFLEETTAGLERHASAALAGTNADVIDDQGRVIDRRRTIPSTGIMRGRDYIERLLRRGRNIVSMPGVVFRRAAIRDAFDDSLSIHFGDFVLLMRIAEKYDLFLTNEPLVRVRRHAGQASLAMPFSEGIPHRTRTLLDYCDEYLGRHPDDVEFVARLRRRIGLVHRVGLAWGWAVARSPEEATACRDRLGDTVFDAAAQTLMRTVDRTPVRVAFRSRAWRAVARKIGAAFGV